MQLTKREYVFYPSNKEGVVANVFAAVVSLFCTAFAIVVLALIILVWSDTRTRHHLNKMSTKLLIYCVVLSIPLGLAFAATNLEVNRTNLGFCRFGMWTSIFTYNLLNWLQGCISINLMLALKAPAIFGRHPMARIYWISGCIVSFILATLPIIFNKYGWVPQLHSCWVTDQPGSVGVWQLAITEVPLIMVTVLMFVTTTLVTLHLKKERKAGRTTGQLLNQLYEPAIDDGIAFRGSSDTAFPSRFEVREITVVPNDKLFELHATPPKSTCGSNHSEAASEDSRSPRSTWRSPFARSPRNSIASPSAASIRTSNSAGLIGQIKWKSQRLTPQMPQITEEVLSPRKLRVAKLPISVNFGKDPKAAEARELRLTLLRIAVYPVIHLIIAVLGPMGSLLLDSAENRSRSYQVSLYLLSLIGTAWIPFAYSCCAVFADASLYHGLQEWFSLRRDRETEDLEMVLGKNKHRWSEYENSHSVDLVVTSKRVSSGSVPAAFGISEDILLSTPKSIASSDMSHPPSSRVNSEDGIVQNDSDSDELDEIDLDGTSSARKANQKKRQLNPIFPIPE